MERAVSLASRGSVGPRTSAPDSGGFGIGRRFFREGIRGSIYSSAGDAMHGMEARSSP